MRNRNYLIAILVLLLQACSLIPDSGEMDSHGTWLQAESENYVYYYRPNSAAAADIDKIEAEQERVFVQLNEILGTSYNQKIHVYIFNDLADAGFTDKTGQAFPILNTIEVIYGSDGYTIGKRGISAHEVAHIITFNAWGPTDLRILSEGIAVYMEHVTYDSEANYDSSQMIVAALAVHGGLPDIESLASDFGQFDTNISYPVSGSFSGYIIHGFGMEKYRKLFTEGRRVHFAADFQSVYGVSLSDVENTWGRQSDKSLPQ
ncbi:peptidase MA family metallohydrolase [Prolixibacter sp. SD074]|uniref:peptidase MA family metallohydrolase n=1 Tax=Prolixibacter sp. SD074 TaxID=2652391 RepID=UPI001275C0E1|nr:hypothetical protein [Prolixibacter sp. SD074]GET30659.1 hypothetical protein SD074_28610 [Prolixibacter sp. SD074]